MLERVLERRAVVPVAAVACSMIFAEQLHLPSCLTDLIAAVMNTLNVKLCKQCDALTAILAY